MTNPPQRLLKWWRSIALSEIVIFTLLTLSGFAAGFYWVWLIRGVR